MKIITILLFAIAASGQSPTKPTPPNDVLGQISKETSLTLQLVEAKEELLMVQRNAAVQSECAKYKLDASKQECYLDTKTGTVKRALPATSQIVVNPITADKPAEVNSKK